MTKTEELYAEELELMTVSDIKKNRGNMINENWYSDTEELKWQKALNMANKWYICDYHHLLYYDAPKIEWKTPVVPKSENDKESFF